MALPSRKARRLPDLSGGSSAGGGVLGDGGSGLPVLPDVDGLVSADGKSTVGELGSASSVNSVESTVDSRSVVDRVSGSAVGVGEDLGADDEALAGLSALDDRVSESVPDRVDHVNKRIVPTGGRRARIKDKHLDGRRNNLRVLKLLRLFIVLVLLFVLGLGVKNTWFPKQVYSNEDIELIANNAVGRLGFPLEKGRAYAQEFLFNYLNTDDSKVAKQLLSRFYTGSKDAGSVQSGRGVPFAKEGQEQFVVKQRPVLLPILFGESEVSDYSAFYKFSVFVSNTDGEVKGAEGELSGHWLSFQVNVFYDKKTDSVSVAEDPQLIPSYVIRKPSQLPKELPLGSGEVDDVVSSKMESTVVGFLEAFAKSSLDDHGAVDQYIPASKPVELVSGFGGGVSLASSGGVSFKVFKTDESNVWKVDASVKWVNEQVSPEGSGVSFSSRYVLTVERTSAGVFLVTKFAPYVFVADGSSGE